MYKPNDHYARKAKKENFVARSIYKLEEIDQRFHLLKQHDIVLDLGASPGSWMQFASRKVGENGKVIGIDLKPITIKLPNAVNLLGDMLSPQSADMIAGHMTGAKADAVLSDMAPNTSGNKFVDQARSLELCEMAFEMAKRFLRNGGNFVCKIFDGEDAMSLRDAMRKSFREVHILRPKSVQSSSKEMFLIGKGFQS